MTIQTNSYLCSRFLNNCVPSQQDFWDLIDSAGGTYQHETCCAVVAKYDGNAAGNSRGTFAIDLQIERSAATQVATTAGSMILGGANNTVVTSSTGSLCSSIMGVSNCIETCTSASLVDVIGGCNNFSQRQSMSGIIGGSSNYAGLTVASQDRTYQIGGELNCSSLNRKLSIGGCNNKGSFGGEGHGVHANAGQHVVGGLSNVPSSGANATLHIGGASHACSTLTIGGLCNLSQSATESLVSFAQNCTCSRIEGYGISGECNYITGSSIYPAIVMGCKVACTTNGVGINYGHVRWSPGSRTGTIGQLTSGFTIQRLQTTSGTQGTMSADAATGGNANRLVIPVTTAMSVTVYVVAYRTGGVAAGNVGDSGFWIIDGLIKAVSTTTTLVGQSTEYSYKDDAAWDVTLAARDTAPDALEISVTGAASQNINWVARIEYAYVRGA